MYTFQDFEACPEADRPEFLLSVIAAHQSSELYKEAVLADEYDAQRNRTVIEFTRKVFSTEGVKVDDPTASDYRICSNFFHRLCTQRVMYSLGNGVSFVQPREGAEVDEVKELLGGEALDFTLLQAGIHAVEHGVTFLLWDLNRLVEFPVTEFAPLWDEVDGRLRAGVRWWRIDDTRPMTVVLYEEQGVTRFHTTRDNALERLGERRAYVTEIASTPAGGDEVVGERNYGPLPVVPMYGNRLAQSALVGMREAIDSYDLIRSGFADDLQDCAEIWWTVGNAGGMTDKDLARFRDRLKYLRIASVDTDAGQVAQPYTQEVPYAARQAYLTTIRSEIYESFGALDVHAVAAGATNDHIDAAYQPMDENAADFEHWVAEALRQVLRLQGVDDSPVFKRQRISNQKEQVDMLVQEAAWLDEKTILRKLPNLTPDEAQAVITANENEEMARMGIAQQEAEG